MSTQFNGVAKVTTIIDQTETTFELHTDGDAILDKAIDMGVENSMRKIKILPSDESSDIVVATIWVDTTAMVARKVVSTTKKAGTVTIELSYDNAKARAYALPSFTKISMEMDPLKIPKSISGDFDGNSRKPTAKPGPVKATVQVWYNSYVIK